MRKSNLKSFSIKNLFGDRTVEIPFNDDVKILIGENGLGKTTALNILYYTLTTKFYKLKDFDFESIELRFIDNTSDIFISKEDVLKYQDLDLEVPSHVLNHLSQNLSNYDIEEIGNLFINRASPIRIIEKLESINYKLFSKYYF